MSSFSARTASTIREIGYHRDDGEGNARGLYLQVKPTKDGDGVVRSWCFRFVSPLTRKPRWMGLGASDDVGLADARELARAARKLVKEGTDPIEARRRERAEKKIEAAKLKTFGECAEDFLADHNDSWRNKKHRDQWRATLTNDAALLWRLPVASIDTALVLQVLRPIWRKKPETASRLRSRIERVLSFATVSEFRTGENPARWRDHLSEMLPAKSKVRRVRHHPALPYAEMPEFMVKLRSRDSISARALELTILTAARTNEITGARWNEIDFENKTWTIPAERMKAGKEHVVPLSPRAITVLNSIACSDDVDFVFIGPKPGEPISDQAMLELLRGIRPGFTVHGFRSSFRDWAGDRTSFDHQTLEFALAHGINNKSEAAYRRSTAIEKRRRLMEAWSNFCAKPQSSADVVPIRESA